LELNSQGNFKKHYQVPKHEEHLVILYIIQQYDISGNNFRTATASRFC